ncbi:sigma-70 family RNA polymerase sigma factor [Oscillospiraceae bacterium PP1C4]
MYWQDEIEKIYCSYSDDVYRYLFSMCRNPTVAEDLLQSTFLQVIRGITGFRNSSTLKTWIFTIARHEYFHWLKKNQPVLPLDENLPSKENMEGDCEHKDQVQQILDYIGALDEPLPSLMILRLTGGLSFGEIGAILGKTEVWARVTFMRSKYKLLQELKEEYI